MTGARANLYARLAVLLTVACAVGALWVHQTDWGRLTQEGVTVCLPGLGAVVWVHPHLDPDLEAGVMVHEARHVAQARELGCLALMRHVVSSPEGQAQVEAEAFCAEEHWAEEREPWGPDPVELAEAALLDGYPRVRTLPRERVHAIVERACAAPPTRLP